MVVYDEAHNTTSEQVELLDDLNPAGFFVASASALRGKLQFYLFSLPTKIRSERFVPVSTRAVVEAELLKSMISLAHYDSSPEETLMEVVGKCDRLEAALKSLESHITPKAIYVVETSNAKKGEDARPIVI